MAQHPSQAPVVLAEQAVEERLARAIETTVPDIAATLGIPEGTVRSRLHYAVRQLRTALDTSDARALVTSEEHSA